MILVDTNVIIDFWKNPNQEVEEIFKGNELAICPIIRIELIAGAKNEREKAKIDKALSDIQMLNIDEKTWELVEKILFTLRRKGITIPFQDAVIAAVAIRYDCKLMTKDTHFTFLAKVINELQIFE